MISPKRLIPTFAQITGGTLAGYLAAFATLTLITMTFASSAPSTANIWNFCHRSFNLQKTPVR